MNRPQPDGCRHQGAAEFHTVFSHTWSGIIQNKLDWALWCQLGNQTLDVLLKIIIANIVLFENLPPVLQTIRTCSATYFQIRCEWLQIYRTLKWFVWNNSESWVKSLGFSKISTHSIYKEVNILQIQQPRWSSDSNSLTCQTNWAGILRRTVGVGLFPSASAS